MKKALAIAAAAFVMVCGVAAPAVTQWSTYQGNAGHDGFVPVTLNPTTLSLKWQQTISTYRLKPITAADGKVFVSFSSWGVSGMNLYALDANTGQTKWSTGYNGANSVCPPAYANGKVYIETINSTNDSHLWSYDANTGSLAYQSSFAAQWQSYYAPTIYDNTVYVGAGEFGGLYAFDGSSGQQKWSGWVNQYDGWTPTVDSRYAYAYTGRYNPALQAFDRITGNQAFSITDPGFVWDGWRMNQAPALGTLSDAFGINGNRLICFDLDARNIRWQSKRLFSGQATVANGVVYAIDGGQLSAIDESTGNWLWTWATPQGNLTGTILATQSCIFVGTSDATYAVDLGTHTTAWSYAAGGLLALSDNTLYISGSNGVLTALAVPEPSSLLALLCGLGGIGGFVVRRRK